jgi:NAD(P)-dependent dehydrogenase (short-subunit alcohol dehydrogenase family)
MSKEPMNSFAGKWALIAGASSGLGLEFADILAAQKVNLVLAGQCDASGKRAAVQGTGSASRTGVCCTPRDRPAPGEFMPTMGFVA